MKSQQTKQPIALLTVGTIFNDDLGKSSWWQFFSRLVDNLALVESGWFYFLPLPRRRRALPNLEIYESIFDGTPIEWFANKSTPMRIRSDRRHHTSRPRKSVWTRPYSSKWQYVVDEVDILADETFGPQLWTVSEAVPNLEQRQFVFVTSTLSDQIV